MFVLATVLPKEYESEAIAVISVGSGNNSAGLSSLVSDLPIPSFLKGSSGTGEQLDLAETIISSDKFRYDLIYQFKYDSIYNRRGFPRRKKAREILIKKFNKKMDASIDDMSAIHVTMLDNSPERAADVANTTIIKADSILNKLSIEMAEKRFHFFDKQIQKQKEKLNLAEDAIRSYQEKNNVVLPEEQASATMEASVDLDVRIISAEINLKLLQERFQENHPQIIETKQFIKQLKNKRKDINYSSDDNAFFPIRKLPKTMVEFGRLRRDYRIQLGVFQTLIPELESAKLEQYKNLPSLQFIQKATPAERRKNPPRLYWTIGGFLFGFINLTCFYCFAEYKKYLEEKEPGKAKLLSELIDSFLRIIPFRK